MQNQTGSNPKPLTNGMNTGMKINSTEIQSRKNPAMKATARNSSTITQALSCVDWTISLARATPPAATKTPANMLPPSRITMIMQVTFSVLISASRSTPSVKDR